MIFDFDGAPAHAEPVGPDDEARAVLAEEVGFTERGELRETMGHSGPWLLYATPAAMGWPSAFGEAPVLAFLGVVDYVRVLSTTRLEIEAGMRRAEVLRRLGVLALGAEPTSLRYLALVADQYDVRARRVQRVGGGRVKLTGVDLGARCESMVVGAETTLAHLAWWSSYPIAPVARDAAEEVDVRAFGAGQVTRW